MTILTEAELLAALNAIPGVSIERRAFGRSIRPLMIARDEAKQAAAGRTQPWVYDGRELWQWREYLFVRAELIRRGVWSAKRPYSERDLEDIALLNGHDDITALLYAPEPQQGAGHAPA